MTWFKHSRAQSSSRHVVNRRTRLEALLLENRLLPAGFMPMVSEPDPIDYAVVQTQATLLASAVQPAAIVAGKTVSTESGIAEPGPNAGMQGAAVGNGFTGVNHGWIEKVGSVVAIRGANVHDTATVRYITFLGGPLSPMPSAFIRVTLSNTYGIKTKDYVAGTVSKIEFFGYNGNDKFTNGTHIASMAEGGNGNDTLLGGYAADDFRGRAGSDTLKGGPGNDKLYGGANVDNLQGQGGNDTLAGNDDADTLTGGSGNDLLSGGLGNDTLYGEAGDDELYGDSGNDTVDGGEDDDDLNGSTGEDKLYGRAGDDWIGGGDQDDELYGSEDDDVLVGGDGDDYLSGGDGDDDLIGQEGEDSLNGGDDHDWLYGSEDDDYLNGGAGNDELFGVDGDDELHGIAGDDYLSGGDGDDLLKGGDDEDELYGGGDDDVLMGYDGDDVLDGGDGHDNLYGHDGDDELLGGAGRDALFAGYGWDDVTGGADPDRFLTFDPDGDGLNPFAGDHDFMLDFDDDADALIRFVNTEKNWSYSEIEDMDRSFAALHHNSLTQDTRMLRTPDGDWFTFGRVVSLTEVPDGYPPGSYAGVNTGGGNILIADKAFTLGEDGTLDLIVHEIGHSWQGLTDDDLLDISGWTDNPPEGWPFSHIAAQGGWYYLFSAYDSFIDDYARTNPWEDFATTFAYLFTIGVDHDNAGVEDKLEWMCDMVVNA
jgi:Ca2+-binding RTX toxin-like protein